MPKVKKKSYQARVKAQRGYARKKASHQNEVLIYYSKINIIDSMSKVLINDYDYHIVLLVISHFHGTVY